jgi:hypothetical protein
LLQDDPQWGKACLSDLQLNKSDCEALTHTPPSQRAATLQLAKFCLNFTQAKDPQGALKEFAMLYIQYTKPPEKNEQETAVAAPTTPKKTPEEVQKEQLEEHLKSLFPSV